MRAAPSDGASPRTPLALRRLAEHHPDRQIAQVLSRQGRLTAAGLPCTEARVRTARQSAATPAARPPSPDSELVRIDHAATALGVSTFTVCRWLPDGLLPGEQTTPGVLPGGYA